MKRSMAWRTKAFAALLKLNQANVEDADPADFKAHRDKRLRLQQSRLGALIFGKDDTSTEVEERLIDVGGTDLRIRIHRPRNAIALLPGVINFHGGGWVQGNPEQSGWSASRIAARTPAVVVSVAYRLAPENVFPAAVDDCFAATQWVHEHAAELGIDGARLAVMGDSAGGNLAAVVALLARDAGAPALRLQVLVYPSVEMYETYDSEIRNAHAPILTARNMHAFAHLYLGHAYGTEDFRASPIRAASHEGVAPALIQVAEFDPLLDQGWHYRDVLQAAGVAVTHTEYAGGIHGYLSLPGPVPSAHRALDEIVESLRAAFGERSLGKDS